MWQLGAKKYSFWEFCAQSFLIPNSIRIPSFSLLKILYLYNQNYKHTLEGNAFQHKEPSLSNKIMVHFIDFYEPCNKLISYSTQHLNDTSFLSCNRYYNACFKHLLDQDTSAAIKNRHNLVIMTQLNKDKHRNDMFDSTRRLNM